MISGRGTEGAAIWTPHSVQAFRRGAEICPSARREKARTTDARHPAAIGKDRAERWGKRK